MIVLKTSRELAAMRDAGRIAQRALRLAGEASTSPETASVERMRSGRLSDGTSRQSPRRGRHSLPRVRGSSWHA